MKIAEAIGAAFGTFSRIPVPKSAWTDFGSTHALAAFPLVGVAEGFLMTAWGHVANLLGVPATIVAAVLVALPVAVTGGIHLDGLCDTSDALASWAPRERKLEIMHDPQAGAFGVIGVVVLPGATELILSPSTAQEGEIRRTQRASACLEEL